MPKAKPAKRASPELAPIVATVDPAPALPELEQTLAALQAGRLGLATTAALAAWRRLRAPRLGQLVAKLGAEASRSLAPLEGQRAQLQEAWLDLAACRRAVDVERLLARLGDASMPQLRARFEALGGFSPDPRLVGAMLTVVSRYHSYEIGPSINLALDLAKDSGDPAARTLVERFVAEFLTPDPGDSSSWREFLEKNGRKVEKVLARLPSRVEVPTSVERQIEACEQVLRSHADRAVPSEAELLAELAPGADPTAELLARVLENPHDVQARMIYGDALQDRGDPRGELIVLQSSEPTAASEKRVKALLKEHARGWIAPLDLCVRPDSIRFERGFLSACRVEFTTPKQRSELLRHPLWATVEEIDCDDQELLLGENLVSLRRATLLPASLAVLARRANPVPLEAVIGRLEMNYGVRMRAGISAGPIADWGEALNVGALKNLTSLELAGWAREESARIALDPASLEFLLASPLGAQLKELRLDYVWDVPPLRSWIDAMLARPPGLRLRCTFCNANTSSGVAQIVVSVTLERVGDTVRVELGFNHDMVDLRYLTMPGQIERLLRGLPHPNATTVVTRYTGSKKRTERGFPAIAAGLAAAFETVEEL